MTTTGQGSSHRDTLAISAIFARSRNLRGFRIMNVAPIGSAGNPVSRVETDSGAFAVRFAGRQRFVDCAAEFENQRRAFEIDLAPRPITLDERTGAIVSEWLPGVDAAAEIDTRADSVTASVAESLARLHCLAAPFPNIMRVETVLDFNLAALASPGSRIEALASSARLRLSKLDLRPSKSCHGDPTLGNWVIDDNTQARLVDWEYSHRTTAAWDLAIICNELEATGVATGMLHERYARESSRLGAAPIDGKDLRIMQGVAALVTAAWSMRYESNQNLVERYLEKAEQFLD